VVAKKVKNVLVMMNANVVVVVDAVKEKNVLAVQNVNVDVIKKINRCF
jgi:hypothetical protein